MVSWQAFIAQEREKTYLQKLSAQIAAERSSGNLIYPPEEDVFRAFELTPLHAVKVVILGQDPYHQPRQAHGLAFSVPRGEKTPPSLKNIYKAIQHDYPSGRIPEHGDLQQWAEQGVLLLNTALTVRESAAGSHAKLGWQTFTENALRYLTEHRTCAYLLWGKHAQRLQPLIEQVSNDRMRMSENKEAATDKRLQPLILTAVHPSPLSAHRGFLTCGHFAQVNHWLTQQGQSPIHWLDEGSGEEQQYTLL